MSAVEAVQEEEPNSWWTTLKHQGVLLSPIILEEIFPNGPPSLGEREYEKVRRSHKKFRNDSDHLYDWLDVVLEDILGHSTRSWVKETHVPAEFRRGDLRPNRVLLNEDDEARAMVWIDTDRVTTDDGEPGRIGIYSGKRTHAKLVRLLRETGTDVGILTNGHQFRVVYATLDNESWTEWDAQAWFQGGEGRGALRGFYGLLSDDVLPAPSEDEEESLIGRIEASRDRQADLSDVMGTQVREAVELLLKDLDALLMEMSEEEREAVLAPLTDLDLSRRDELRARYQAAIRIVMRLVVALYAESRELFPKDNPVYYNSYSVEGLFSDLREARIEEGEDTLEKQYSAWPRLQALSRLVYHGSPHSDVPLRAYGGRLFRPPGEDEDDDVLAGLAAFENDDIRLSDATILEVLEGLKIAEFKSGGQRRTGPVDFSDLRTEYIGMMYEGLLDYELREASEDDGAILFLNIGDQPALPFNVLENLDDKGIENLVDNLKDNASDSFLADDKVSENDFEEDEDELNDEEEAGDDRGGDEDELERGEFDTDLDARVHRWAKRVVEETRVYMPHFNTVRAMDPTTREKYENEAARRVVDRIIRPGGTYLVSHSGTRKSTGTFYTPPGLAVPTVRRTLEPLAYEGNSDTKIPKKPEEILDLQVCDPAMGSGTFPVAALRYLTDALKESFDEHVFPEVDEGDPIAAPLGDTAKGYLNERLLEIRKGENEDWQDRLEMQLKRSVVERCIYGVDINPLAVELGKLSLWIETLDPKLPFTFLDHKLRVGNSLIGTWLHEFEHYPVAAWNREGGDGRKGERTKRIKNFRNNGLKDQMQIYIRENLNQTHWFEPEASDDTHSLLQEVRNSFEKLHVSINEAERERLYQKEIQENEDIEQLRHLMDRWCAIWFWPLPSDDSPILDPKTFYDTSHDLETDLIVQELSSRDQLSFFHWEIEFPDVFIGQSSGFDAAIGNPPWEIEKPQESEFFSRYRPEFRTLNKSGSNRIKKELFDDQPDIERRWHEYREYYRGFSNYVKHSSNPWAVPLARGKRSRELSDKWARIRNDSESTKSLTQVPYRYQGSADLNTYKLFSERFYYLSSDEGRIGILTPDGLYLGDGTSDLRNLFVNESRWEWLYSFYNKEGMFDIPSQDKFNISIVQKGMETNKIKCNFNQTNADEWRSTDPQVFTTTQKQINRFSPESNVIMEVTSERDLSILDTIFENGTLIRNTEFGYSREFDTANDSDYFMWTHKLEKRGYNRNDSIFWTTSSGDRAVPLVQGKAIHHFDFPYQSYWKPKDQKRSWYKSPHHDKLLKMKYMVDDVVYRNSDKTVKDVKIVYRRTTQPIINPRSMIAAIIPDIPTADSVFLMDSDTSGVDKLAMLAILNSYAFDFVIRFRIPGINLSAFIVEEAPIPNMDKTQKMRLASLSAKLNWHPEFFMPLSEFTEGELKSVNYTRKEGDRAELMEEIDQIVASSFGLSEEDMNWILRRDNDDPRALWKDYKERLSQFEGQGHWESGTKD